MTQAHEEASEPSAGTAGSRREAGPELLARARHDRSAFGELYDLYVRRVYAFCAVDSTTREEPEDLTAQTFLRALAAIGTYEDRGAPFSAWLLRIAANAMADSRRKTKHPTIRDTDGLIEERETRQQPQGDHWAERWERAYWLHSHLSALPSDQQQVIQLRFYDDCTFAEVARQMGRTEGAVQQLLRRALGTLRARLLEEATGDV